MKNVRLTLALFFLLLMSASTGAVVNGVCEYTPGDTSTDRGFINCDEELSVRVPRITSVTALRALTTTTLPSTNSTVRLLSWQSGLNLGGGIFVYDASDTTSFDNNCTVFVDNSSRRWKRQVIANTISPEDCSADLDPTTNDTAAVQAALDYLETVGGTLNLNGHYLLTATAAYAADQPISIRGQGADNSSLTFDVGAGVNGLTLTFGEWLDAKVPEVTGIGIFTKKPATVAGIALKVSYSALSGGSRKGIVIANIYIDAHADANPNNEYWTVGIDLTYTPHSHVSNSWIQGRAGLTSVKSGAGIHIHTWCNGSSFRDNKIRGWLNGFLVQSTFADGDAFQFEGVSITGSTFTANDWGINADMWVVEGFFRIADNNLDNARGNVRFKNIFQGRISDNEMFWNDQRHAHTDILIITTAPDAGGLPENSSSRTTISNNGMSRRSLNNAITGITQTNPAVVTYSGDDNWVNGDKIFLTTVVGMTEVNKIAFTLANLNTGANTFSLRNEDDTANIDSTLYNDYTSGGIVEGFSIALDIQGGDGDIVAENYFQDRSVGMRLGALVETIQVDRNYTIGTDIKTINNMVTTPDEILVGRTTQDDILEELGLTSGLNIVDGDLNLDLTELNSVVWGSAAGFTTMRFDAGATDPVLTFSSGGTIEFSGQGSSPQITFDDQGTIRFNEEDANGNNGLIFQPPANITATHTCAFENDANFIPDSCVGDGIDDGAGAAGDNARIEDGNDAGTFTAMQDLDFDDSGDINFIRAAGPPDVLTATVRNDSVALTGDTTGNYAAGDGEAGAALTGDSATGFFSSGTIEDAHIDGSLEINEVLTAALGGSGIDVASQIADFDATELSTLTWGAAGGGFVWTFDAGATDATFTFGAGGAVIFGTNDSANPTSLIIDDEGSISLREEAANGTNSVKFSPPTSIALNRACTFVDAAAPIPTSCLTADNEFLLFVGTTTASSLNMPAGTLETTPEDGDIEMDANCMYLTTDAGNRGCIQNTHSIRLTANYTLTSSGTEQKLFNSSANGRLTLELGTYDFECSLGINTMSATSGNAAFDPIGAGTAVGGTFLYRVVGADAAAITTIGALSGSQNNTQQTAASMVTAATGVALQADVKGSFIVTTAGTIIPSITLVTAASAVVLAGSYCSFTRTGSTTVTTTGQWD